MANAIITLGCDPEIMLVDNNGNLKSAIPVISGGKDNPIPVTNGFILHDNVNAEFGVDPATNAMELTANIKDVLSCLNIGLSKKGFLMSTLCAADFPKSELRNREAQQFGCTPDYDCWTVEQNFIDPEAATKVFRTAGGHIHIGHESIENDFSGKINMVRLLDATLGLVSIVVDNSEMANKRRNLYGKAGCHRPTKYGIEYRTLSNFWIKSQAICQGILEMAQLVAEYGVSNDPEKVIDCLGQDAIVSAINGNNPKLAESLIEKINIPGFTEKFNDVKNLDYNINLITDGWTF